MNLVSIIIPMFNELNNIEQCVEVLKQQKSQKFDVLFIDDGSTDGTATYLESILNKEIGFEYKIITQKNRGAAEARRVGIEKADTEFILVYDCDDKLSNNLVEEIYKIYDILPDTDIVMPKMSIEDKNGIWKDFTFYTNSINFKPVDCIVHSLNGWYIHGCFAIRRDLILKSYKDYSKYNLSSKNYINNDEVITRLNFLNSNNIIKSEGIYYYCYNKSSTTNKVNTSRYLTINNALILDEIFRNDSYLSIEAKKQLISVLWSNIIYMYKNKKNISNISDWKKNLAIGSKALDYTKIIRKVSIKKKVQLTTIKLFVFL